jgi:hypothetical protein
MKSLEEYRQLNEASKSSSKAKGMNDLVNALRKILDEFDLPTRKFLWERLNTEKGKELMDKILRNPKTSFSNSEFVKLVTTSKK